MILKKHQVKMAWKIIFCINMYLILGKFMFVDGKLL